MNYLASIKMYQKYKIVFKTINQNFKRLRNYQNMLYLKIQDKKRLHSQYKKLAKFTQEYKRAKKQTKLCREGTDSPFLGCGRAWAE